MDYEAPDFLLTNNFFSFIGTANFAYAMGKFELAALITTNHSRNRQLEMGTPFIPARF